jgi:hypothetical protein
MLRMVTSMAANRQIETREDGDWRKRVGQDCQCNGTAGEGAVPFHLSSNRNFVSSCSSGCVRPSDPQGGMNSCESYTAGTKSLVKEACTD